MEQTAREYSTGITVNYCSECGSDRLVYRLPQGDTRKRTVCNSCGHTFYSNPKIVTGCILEWQKRILLCKRAIEPRINLWTVPAGFLENGESVIEAAAREAEEEACAKSENLVIHSFYNIRYVNQVYILYRGSLKDGNYGVGHESNDAMLCAETDIPWQQIAFPVIADALKLYFADRGRCHYEYHEGDIYKGDDNQARIVRY